jgi:hypothetical protein
MQDNNSGTSNYSFKYRDGAWPGVLTDNIPAIEKAKGKHLVLVIGNTRAGKSTLVNQLLLPDGYSMYYEPNPETGVPELCLPRALPPNIVFAKMGKPLAAAPETVCPGIYGADCGALCDCPGYEAENSLAEKTMAVMNIPLLASVATIRGLVIVVDFPSIAAVGGAGFKKLVEKLRSLIVNPNSNNVLQSLLLVVTKAPTLTAKGLKTFLDSAIAQKEIQIENLMPHTILDKIKDILGIAIASQTIIAALRVNSSDSAPVKALRKSARMALEGYLNTSRSEQNNQKNDARHVEIKVIEEELAVLHLLSRLIDSDRFVITDPLTTLSRVNLRKRINAFAVLPREEFSFNSTDSDAFNFRREIIRLASEFILTVKSFCQNLTELDEQRGQLVAHDESILSLRRLLATVNGVNGEFVAQVQREIDGLNIKILVKKNYLTFKEELIADHKTAKNSVDTAEPVAYKEDSECEKRHSGWMGLFGYLGWTTRMFVYDGRVHGYEVPYESVKYYAIEGNSINGKIDIKEEPQDKLHYSACYTSDTGKDANVRMIVWVQKKFIPENVLFIRWHGEEIAKREVEKNKIEIALKALEDNLTSLTVNMNDLNNKERLREKWQNDLSKLESERPGVVAKVDELERIIALYKKQFKEDRLFIDCIAKLVKDIGRGLGFDANDAKFKEFFASYKCAFGDARGIGAQETSGQTGFFASSSDTFDQPGLRARL